MYLIRGACGCQSMKAMSDCTFETAYKLTGSRSSQEFNCKRFASCTVKSTSEEHSIASNATAATTLGEVDGCDVDTSL